LQRHKKSTTSRAAARSHESHLSKLDKAQGIKLDQLVCPSLPLSLPQAPSLSPHLCKPNNTSPTHDQKQELDEKEKQLRRLGMDFDLTQKLTTADKARSTKAIKSMKQQVSHERHLKLDAFHEVDQLISQVLNTLCVKRD
jgi:hypothetical protein